jgi:plasmid maintenance system antidote protein VapI
MKVTIESSRKGENEIGRLFAGPPSIESEAEYQKLMIVEELLTLMKDQGISRSELAERMGVQPSRVTSMLTGSNNFTIETLVRAGRAVGADIELHFVPAKAAKKKGSKSASKVAETPTTYRAGKKAAKKSNPKAYSAKASKTKSAKPAKGRGGKRTEG